MGVSGKNCACKYCGSTDTNTDGGNGGSNTDGGKTDTNTDGGNGGSNTDGDKTDTNTATTTIKEDIILGESGSVSQLSTAGTTSVGFGVCVVAALLVMVNTIRGAFV